jgi:hypothetical protein
MRVRYAAVTALLVLGGCSSDGGAGAPGATPTDQVPSSEPATEQPATPTGPLDWQPVDGPPDRPVTLNAAGDRVTGGAHRQAFLTDTHSLMVEQDPQETEPARAVLTDLATGAETVLDGSSPVPTTTGGTWALGDATAAYATVDPSGAYCLATLDLATGEATRAWCAPADQGFTDARITDAGTTLQTFDDARPACRTVGTLEDGAVTPFPDAPDCTAWDGLLLESGRVWSVVRNERDVERADFFATGADGPVELGPGTSGSLVACGGSAYFVRDPQSAKDPAALVRWDGTAAEVVYESPAGPAFLDQPRCGGDVLTVTAYAEGGDEQVSARVG